MNAQLSIRPGVYFAAVQGEGVIMDLVADRYYGLGAESAAMWRDLLERRVPPPTGGVPASDLVVRQLDAWRQARLVTAEPDVPVDLPALKPIGAPAVAGLDADRIAATAFSWRCLVDLLRGARWSRRALKQRGICATLRRLQQVPARPAHDAPLDDVTYRMLRVYRASRRISSQGKDDCLPRSLGLAMALRRRGVDAEICFGVRKFPFAAHAWVEARGRAINEPPSGIQRYALLARF